MDKQQRTLYNRQTQQPKVSVISLGGIEDIQKNMYLYEYEDEILIVDCGIGFADETMLGVDLLLPDITYLLNTKKRIVGMALTHGHEDHIGALPYLLPQLPNFPIYATPFTASLTNEKLKEFEQHPSVQTVNFEGGDIKIGSHFAISFIRITHSVPDSSHIFIKTPVGNFYHGADFKFDMTPADGKRSDYFKITQTGQQGVLCLLSDCLGAERSGFSRTEQGLDKRFEEEIEKAKGKVFVTTFSSNISRLNQVISAAERQKRRVCFIGRSLIKAKLIAQKGGYLHIKEGTEVAIENMRKVPDRELVLIVAGSQGQENSAMTRIANDEHKDVKLDSEDTVIFSSDPIPGNEISVGALVDTIVKKGVRAVYSDITRDFHVSGHGNQGDLMLLMSLLKPKYLMPISGSFKHMAAYKKIGEQMGYAPQNILLFEGGQELIFSPQGVKPGKKIETKTVYVDQISGEEVESYVLRDREKLAKDGIVIIMAEVNTANGQLGDAPTVVTRGFTPSESKQISQSLSKEIKYTFTQNKKEKIRNWAHLRKQMGDIGSKHIFKELRRRPLVLPVIVEI